MHHCYKSLLFACSQFMETIEGVGKDHSVEELLKVRMQRYS